MRTPTAFRDAIENTDVAIRQCNEQLAALKARRMSGARRIRVAAEICDRRAELIARRCDLVAANRFAA